VGARQKNKNLIKAKLEFSSKGMSDEGRTSFPISKNSIKLRIQKIRKRGL